MLIKLATSNPKVLRVLIAVGALSMMVLSAGAPLGYGG